MENLSNPLRKIDHVLQKKSRWFKRGIIFIWTLTLIALVGLPLYIYVVIKNPDDWFGELPSLRDIENPQHDLSSEIISADGVSLGRYFRYHSSAATYHELSADLVATLLISEDHRFREHAGMDLEAYLRVLKGIVTFSNQGGGSTLTQQTAKNLFRTREIELQGKLSRLASPLAMLISKTKEWIIAVRLEQNFTKEEIIALYLNTAPFNNNAFGIKVAAEVYFNKSPGELNVHESSLLVGMLQGTSRYNPVSHPERATRKRNEVIQKLAAHNYITANKADSLKALPLSLNFTPRTHNEGLAPYFRSFLKKELSQWCEERGYDLAESGLKIYTTIDSRLQYYAEKAMADHMTHIQQNFDADWGKRNPWVDEQGAELKNFLPRKIKLTEVYKNLKGAFGTREDSIEYYLKLKKPSKVFSWQGTRDTLFSVYDSVRYYNRFLQAGLMSMEPETGAVKAWVGGINHSYFKFDHVRQSKRQPGSTFKPVLYAMAIENGYSPCQLFRDVSPQVLVNGHLYHVKNANGTYGDGNEYTLRQALAKSLNSVSLQLIDKLRPENVAAFAQRVGITSKIDPVYSLALGTSEVSLYEIVGAYSTFVNLGIHIKPYYITRIEDKHGNVIENFLPLAKQALDETTAYTMVHMLKGGVEEVGGSSRALSEAVKADNEIGGKTGTTDNGSDGWFIGVTRNLVTGVWVGGDERSIHFPNWGESSGGRAALPIFDKYMQQVYAHPHVGYPKGSFKQPQVLEVNFDCSRYMAQDSVLTIE